MPATGGITNLLLDIVQRVGRVDREADQNDVGIGVREGAETVVVLLTSRIPERQLDMLAINLDVGDVVLEHGGDIDLRTQMLDNVRSVLLHAWSSSGQKASNTSDNRRMYAVWMSRSVVSFRISDSDTNEAAGRC